MQCQSITDVMSSESSVDGRTPEGEGGTLRTWTRRISGFFAVGSGDHDTRDGVWNNDGPGLGMSPPLSVDSAAKPDESSGAGGIAREGATATVVAGSNELANVVRSGDPSAIAKLFDLYGTHVERVLIRTLGRDHELDDMIQDVFLGAYRSGPNYQGNDDQLKAWVSRIAVFTARGYLRKRRRRWWLRSEAPDELPEQAAADASPHIQEVLRRTYSALDQLDPDLRIPLALRELEAMELAEIADACQCSVSTIKRRLQRARKAFERLAKKDPLLRDWLLEDEQ
ncbi:MAG: sigma-70 family RNA polymerase sigma factor [Deltaproteobacteria bacterium]|nr:sigma-70 family RNA polymerase sigma factor [Deltaproteobacteria bacterium]